MNTIIITPPIVPTIAPAIPWYKSPQILMLITTFIAAAVSLYPKLGTMLGLTSPDAIQTAVENLAGMVALVVPVIGAIVRSLSKVQPLTLTQSEADAHPNTIAAAIQSHAVPAATIIPPTWTK